MNNRNLKKNQTETTIAIQGYPGSFHHIVANQFFGSNIELNCCKTFPELTKWISHAESAKANHFAVMAIENSLAGSLLPNYGLLQKSGAQIIGEVYLHINQNLLGMSGQKISEIKEIHSHPMALLQCRDFLETLSGVKIVESEDTALSAQIIADNKIKGQAAIASSLAAELFGLKILKKNIQSDKRNYTRFLILANDKKSTTEINKIINQKVPVNKTSIYFEVSHKVGSLAKILSKIAENKINLSKLQSFPIIGREWHYYFHADLEFSNLNQINKLFNYLKKHTVEFRHLGFYPKGR